MNFGYMTTSQTASLIVAVILTVIAFATTLLTIKYAKNVSFGKAILLCLCAPFLAMIAWLFLIFSFLDGFRNNELLNILISILIAVFICAMLILVARTLYRKNKDKMENEDYEAELKKELAEQEQANVATEAPAQTLLLADAVNKENNDEPVVEEVSEEEIFDEAAMDSMPAEAVKEEALEEEMEDTEEQPVENVEVETEQEENAEDTEETENTEDTAKEEETEEETSEGTDTAEVENEDNDDDDEEFEAFLEALRKKAENK